MEREALVRALDALPLFPLPETVLLPGSLLPLHVFEPRYRQLVKDLLASGGPLSVPQLAEDGASVLPYAGVGVLGAHHALPDGRYNIVVEPVARVRILGERHDVGTPYRVGRAELLDDLPADPEALAAVGRRVRGLMGALLARVGSRAPGLAPALAALPAAKVPDALAGLVLPDPAVRQAFLAENDPLARARLVEDGVLALLAEAMEPVAEG